MLVEYLCEQADKMEKQGYTEDEIVQVILNKFDLDEEAVRTMVKFIK